MKKKNTLITELKNLKLEYSRNNLIILEKERGLSDLLEFELKEELSHIKAFERLNDEKITPHFLNMAKKVLNPLT